MRGCHSLQGNCNHGFGPFLMYLGKSQCETALGIAVRVWARTLSLSSAGILPAWGPSLMAVRLPGARALGVRVWTHALDKWLLTERPRSNLLAARWEGWSLFLLQWSLCSAGWYHSRPQSCRGVAWAPYPSRYGGITAASWVWSLPLC